MGGERKKPAPVVFGYHDYRAFLKDLLDHLKSERGLSLRELARRAGVAAGTLPMFLSGKRALAEETLAKLLPHLELDDASSSYLRNLCRLAESESHDERASTLRRLRRFHGYQEQSRAELEVSRYLSHWYYVVVREMAAWPEFRLDPEWIRERLRFAVSTKQVETALAFLLEHGFISKLDGGRASVADKPLVCDGGVYRVSLSRFHAEMLGLAARSIEDVPREERLILGHTVSIAPERFDEVKAILERAQREIRELGTVTREGGTVIHVAFTAVPLTGKVEKKS